MEEISPDHKSQDDVGGRLKHLRKSRGLTLVQLSKVSGVSRSALSKIERSEISPTYSTIRKIALGLDLTIAALLAEQPSVPKIDIEIVRADENDLFRADDTKYQLLAGASPSRAVRCFVAEVTSCDTPTTKGLHTHNTQDIVFILSGSMICHFEDHPPMQLNKGDSLYYGGHIPHAFTRLSDDACHVSTKALWVSMPSEAIV
ncbi:MAG: XRE family transcriptional regulator [Henriciella sp.]